MDNDELLSTLQDIQEKVDALMIQLKTQKKQVLTLAQFCEFVDMSQYSFQKYYDLHKHELALCEPRTRNGNQPRYSFSDIAYFLRFVKAHRYV